MTNTFSLRIENSATPAVHIVLAQVNQDYRGNILVTPICTSFTEFEQHVNDLVSELRQLKQTARQKFIEAGQSRNKKRRRRTR